MTFVLIPKSDGYYAPYEGMAPTVTIVDDLNYLLCADSYCIELSCGAWPLRGQVLVTRLEDALLEAAP